MVTYACEQPGFLNPDGSPGAWECGADYNHRHEGLVHAPSCNGTFRPIHFVGSPEEGQDLVLPSGFGFEVGGSTPFKYIVIEAHFTVMGELFDHNRTGTAGTTFTAVQQRDHLLKNAGYLPAKAYGRLEPNAVSTVHGYYPINEPMNMHPIALASHTHDLGIGVSIYKVARDGERTLMFHQDPRKDKQFRPPLQQNLTLTTGDAIAFSCAYNNTSPEWIDVL